MSREIAEFCRRVADDSPGAAAVVLVGSQARGTATKESDVDLLFIGEGHDYRLEVREGRLLASSWRLAQDQRRRFADPKAAVAEVPAWRSAVVICDDSGIASELRREAADWTWDVIATAARESVADEVTGLAEEVHKLVAALASGHASTAAVQRGLLALHLPMTMVIHFKQLYESENDVWDIVAGQAGEEWGAIQEAALGIRAVTHAEGCAAALHLYCLAADLIRAQLDARQELVVRAAVALAKGAVHLHSQNEAPARPQANPGQRP